MTIQDTLYANGKWAGEHGYNQTHCRYSEKHENFYYRHWMAGWKDGRKSYAATLPKTCNSVLFEE
jgi:hypothetical protein